MATLQDQPIHASVEAGWGGVRQLSTATLDIDTDAVAHLGTDIFFVGRKSKYGLLNDKETFLGDSSGRRLILLGTLENKKDQFRQVS